MELQQSLVEYVSSATRISNHQVKTVLDLHINQECTVPFITRYRKDMTQGLNENQIRAVVSEYEFFNQFAKRKEFILSTLQEMGVLTDAIKKDITRASNFTELEDIYAPYKEGKKTKAGTAKEAGLEPLAEFILTSKQKLETCTEEFKNKFINPEKEIPNFQAALSGANDIIIETISRDPKVKSVLRDLYWKKAKLKSQVRAGADKIKNHLNFKDFFDYEELAAHLLDQKNSHRYLAMKRGLKFRVLKLDITDLGQDAINTIDSAFFGEETIANKEYVQKLFERAYQNYIHPQMEVEIKNELKAAADEAAIRVFGSNLKNLLLQPYLGSKAVLGIDPGVKTGCKVVIIDAQGNYVGDSVIYPHPPKQDLEGSKILLDKIIEAHKIEYIAIGNGTYGRETLSFLEEHVEAVKAKKVHATLISEDGASVYSVSEVANEEFPNLDATVRGSISIARRFQDPLAELVKIDPKSIGVGQYQHDVNQVKIKKTLHGIVESCVNYVGVDINTASSALLAYISGIGEKLAKNIVEFRKNKGSFLTRAQLLEIPNFTKKTFEQSAGFLRIYNGKNPFDSTFIHPENYPIITEWLKSKNKTAIDLVDNKELIDELEKDINLKEKLGDNTHRDIIFALRAPSQDPRKNFKSVEFDPHLKSIDDLKLEQWYQGVVTNITQFGAFLDIGLKEKGFVHISEFSNQFIKNPMGYLKIGQEVKARVIQVDKERVRISLSLKQVAAPKVEKPRVEPQRTVAKTQKPAENKDQRNNNRPPRKEKEIKQNPFSVLKNLKI